MRMRRGVRGLGEARRVEEEGRRRRRWRRRRRDGGGGEERKGDWGRGKAKARAAQGRQAGEGKGAVPVRAVSRSPRPGSLLLLFLLQGLKNESSSPAGSSTPTPSSPPTLHLLPAVCTTYSGYFSSRGKTGVSFVHLAKHAKFIFQSKK